MAASSISRSRTANSTDSSHGAGTIIAKVEKAIFGVLHLMLDSRSSGSLWMRIGVLLLVVPRFLTTAALAVSPDSQLLNFLSLFRIEQFFSVKEDPIIFLAVYTLGLFVVWTSIVCAASTAWFFTTGFFSSFVPALFLRAVVGIFITALLNPLLELFLVPFECESLSEYFPDTTTEATLKHIPSSLVLDCTLENIGGMQATLMIISVLSLVAFVPFSIVTKAVYLDTDPVSLDYTSAYTGQLAVYDTLARSILVFATHFLREQQPVLHAIIVILTMGPLTFLSIVKQPYYYKLMNSISCAMYAFVTWLAIESLVLTANRHDDDLQRTISTVMCALLAIIIPLAIAAPIFHQQYVQKALDGVLELVKEKELIERQKMFSKGSFVIRSNDNRPIVSATMASPLVSIHDNRGKPQPLILDNNNAHRNNNNGEDSTVYNAGKNEKNSSTSTAAKFYPKPATSTATFVPDHHSRTATMSSDDSTVHPRSSNKGSALNATGYPDAEQKLVEATLFPGVSAQKKTNNKTRKHLLRSTSTDNGNGGTIHNNTSTNDDSNSHSHTTPTHHTHPHHHHHPHESLDMDDRDSFIISPTSTMNSDQHGPVNNLDGKFDVSNNSNMNNSKRSKAVSTLLGAKMANEQFSPNNDSSSSSSISAFVSSNTAVFRPILGIEFVSVRDSSVQSARAARLFHDRPDLVNAMALLVIKINPRPDLLPVIDHKRHIQAGFFPREAIARAESVFEMGLLAFPSDPDVTIAYARFLGSFVKDSSRAAGMLQRVIKCKPNMEHRFALFSYGRFLEQRRAREDLGEGLDGLGVIAFRQGYASALSAYRQAVAHIAALWKAIEAHRRTLRGSLGTNESSGRKDNKKKQGTKDAKTTDENDTDENNALLSSSGNENNPGTKTPSKTRGRSRSHQSRERGRQADSDMVSSSATSSFLNTSGIMVRIGRIVSARREAQREFEKLLARYTSAAQVLQSYAAFLEHVCMDTLAAQGANARADAAVSGAERPEVGNGADADGENNRAGSIAPTKSAVGVESAYGGQSTAMNSIVKSTGSSNSGSNTPSGSRGGSQSQGGASSSKSGIGTTFSRGNTSGTEAVVRLRSRMQRGMILVALFAIGIFIGTRIVLTDFTTLVTAIYEASHRRYSIVAGSFHARSASLATMDNILSPEEELREWDNARSWLLKEAAESTHINTYLYDTTDPRQTLLFPAVRKLYDDPWFPILYVSGTLNMTRYGGFQEAVQTYIGTMTSVANLPKHAVKYPNCDTQPAWRFLLDNWSGIFKSANLISMVYVDRAFELGAIFIDVSWVLFSLVLLVLYVLLFHVFWPSVKLVQSSNAGVIAIIEAIPLSVVVMQVKKYSMLEISLHAETDKVLDDDADSTQDIDEDELSDSSAKNARHSHRHRQNKDDDSSASYGSNRSSRSSSSASSRSRSYSGSSGSSSDSNTKNRGNNHRHRRDSKTNHSDSGEGSQTMVSSPPSSTMVTHNRSSNDVSNNGHISTVTRVNTNEYNHLKPEGLTEVIGITSPSHDPVPVTMTSPLPLHQRGSITAQNTPGNMNDASHSTTLPGAVASPSPAYVPPTTTHSLSRVPSMVYAPTAHLHGMQHPVYPASRFPPVSVLRTPTTSSNQGDTQGTESETVAIAVSPQPIQIRSDGVNVLDNDTLNSNRYRRSRRDKDGSSKIRKTRTDTSTVTTATTAKPVSVWQRFNFIKRFNSGPKLSPLLRALTFRTAAALLVLASLQALATGLNTSEVKASTYTASSINYGAYRRELAITCVFHARELLIGPDILGDYRFSVQDFRFYLDNFRRYHRGLLYGDPELRLESSLGVSTDQDNLLFAPTTEAFEVMPEQNLSIGTTYASTASRQGLNFLLLQFLNQLEVFISRYEPWWGTEDQKKRYADTYFNGTTPPFDAYKMGYCLHNLTCIHADYDFARIEYIDFGSLDHLLEVSMSYYLDEVTARSNRGLWVQIAVLILNLGVLAVFYFFVTERQFYYLNQEAQRTLELVRLIPVAAIDNSSKLRSIINCNEQSTIDKGASSRTKATTSIDGNDATSGNDTNHGNSSAESDGIESSATSGTESNRSSSSKPNKHNTSSSSLRSRSRRSREKGSTPKFGSP